MSFEIVNKLNEHYRECPKEDIVRCVLTDSTLGNIALVSSFGAESVVLLHMVSIVRPDIPILFIDTGFLFTETHSYRSLIIESFGFTNALTIQALPAEISLEDTDGALYSTNPQACCDLRKVRPLNRALNPFDSWISGRKRFQGYRRETLDIFERDDLGRIKINPLAYWEIGDVESYIQQKNLPRHPLVTQGYPSIGCTLCTTTVKSGEAVRAGRWRGSTKTECGIHFLSGGGSCSD